MKLNYDWTLKDAIFTKDKGKVFSCFACGGGSTMGYKLAGFDVIGFNEIDPKMAECYIENHDPTYRYIEPIQDFKNRDDLPKELYNLDILDGSPPCSSFSMAGNREKDWGKEKKFREGQADQVLDTLFFDFIDVAKKLQPKVVIAENVKGLLMGEAKKYLAKIVSSFKEAGYKVHYKLLNSKDMGVPQKRERVFFYAVRNDIKCESDDMFDEEPFIDLEFNGKEIPFKEVFTDYTDRPLSVHYKEFWDERKPDDLDFSYSSNRLNNKPNSHFNYKYITMSKVANTITASDNCVLFDYPRYRNKSEILKCGSYPKDYNFLSKKSHYLVGMSVPPLMMAKIADRVYSQWLK